MDWSELNIVNFSRNEFLTEYSSLISNYMYDYNKAITNSLIFEFSVVRDVLQTLCESESRHKKYLPDVLERTLKWFDSNIDNFSFGGAKSRREF